MPRPIAIEALLDNMMPFHRWSKKMQEIHYLQQYDTINAAM